jgi:oxygen-independent coproporphyrinogen-3 oxidase
MLIKKEIKVGDLSSCYIHIPFCKRICSYCDFCKFYYNQELVDKYLNSLETEIKAKYKGECLKTLYIGGGTPSCLDTVYLNKLFKIINLFNTETSIEFTFECNIEDINEELLKLLKRNGVSRLSIGIQTFNKELLKVLNRRYDEDAINKIKLANRYFSVNVDLIYAIPGQTLDDLNNDLDILLSLDIDHISCYSLIIEEHTKLYIDGQKSIDDQLDLDMYQLICNRLKNFHHYEISNFSKTGKESKHNLVYWNNDHYYGFGLSSSGYIDDIRYDNTKNINKYINGNYVLNKHRLSLNEQIENEFILGLRKLDGINISDFYKKYGFKITDLDIVNSLINEGKLKLSRHFLYISNDFIYTSNSILVNFLDIDYENMI